MIKDARNEHPRRPDQILTGKIEDNLNTGPISMMLQMAIPIANQDLLSFPSS
jgi:hypothetical protein